MNPPSAALADTTDAGPGRKPQPRFAPNERLNVKSSIPFFAVHFLPLLVIFTGITWTAVALFVVTYMGRAFFITGSYHRYFAHRSYRLNRFFQFIWAFGGTTAAQKGPLWWAAHHRNHHRYSDTDKDVHSPKRGFWWSHVGWILCDKYNATETDMIRDFAKYPEIRFIDKHNWIGPWTLGIACFLIGGWSGLVVGFFLSTVLLWHGTFLVNSLAHVMGRRPYTTGDTSRNSLIIALITGGEGWHNNHHRYQFSARNGFRWYQYDLTYYILFTLRALGIVHDLRPVPVAIKDEARLAKARHSDAGSA